MMFASVCELICRKVKMVAPKWQRIGVILAPMAAVYLYEDLAENWPFLGQGHFCRLAPVLGLTIHWIQKARQANLAGFSRIAGIVGQAPENIHFRIVSNARRLM
jgi:hypothetical protein